MSRTVSHHLLRRTARWKVKSLRREQERARTGDALALSRLRGVRVYPDSHLTVERAERGPWRWRVVVAE